ncbi:phospholipase A2 group XV-like [Ischnura elegans]|uniref:phospholipase A2 group XV-like n=1 Tax=Ischnura elegans TaxID=197161 RepID=UPI001ED886EE|nr:phospholipase A2 group XV-like [Ischnura elegans]
MYRPFIKLVILVNVFGLLTCKREAEIGHPVILVPGDGGSQLEAKLNKSSVVHYLCAKTTDDYFDLWLNLELLVPLVIDCWVDNMKLIYDEKTRTTSNSPGVDIRVPGFGNTSTVEWLDPSQASPSAYFKMIANELVGFGYERGTSIRGAPYDFRKGPHEQTDYFTRMKSLVEETYNDNGKKSVVLLTHSMGGVMALRFLQLQTQTWKDKYIRALVTLAAPWGGAVKSLKVFAVGDNLGVFVVREGVLREEQRSSPSLAWLLPSTNFWKHDEVLVTTADAKNYTVQDFEEFFRDIDYKTGWEMRKDVLSIANDFTFPGVEIHCLHGYGVNTVDRLDYGIGKFPDGYPNLIYGDGDGTVNRRSLEGCTLWQQKNKVYHQPLPDVSHMNILTDDRVIQYLRSLLVGKGRKIK